MPTPSKTPVIATLINRAMEVVTPGQDLVEFEGRSQVIDKRGEIIWER